MTGCIHENEIVRAARTGQWPDDLRSHWAGCAACAEAALVAESLSAAPETEAPAAGLVWFKAELRRRQEAMDQALKPIRWAERAVAATGVLGVVGVLAWAAGTSPFVGYTAVAGVVLSGGLAALSLRPPRSADPHKNGTPGSCGTWG